MARYRRKPVEMVVEAVKPSAFELMDVMDPRTGKRQKAPFPPDAILVTFPNGQKAILPEKVFLAEFELIEDDEDDDGEPEDGGEPLVPADDGGE